MKPEIACLSVFCDDTCPTATGLLGLRHELVIDDGEVAAPALIDEKSP